MAKQNLLNDKQIRAELKSAQANNKSKRIADGGGLYLECKPTGAGWWRLRYFFSSKEKMLSLGTYPAIGLADARLRRDEALRTLATGTDPSNLKKAQKLEAKAQEETAQLIASGAPVPGSFEAVAREWLATVHEIKVSDKHADRTRIRLEKEIFPWLGAIPIHEITAPQLLECLRRITTRGTIETAHRTKDATGQVFRYGIACGLCERNPAADLRDALPPVPTRHFSAVIDPASLGEMLRAIDAYNGGPLTQAALQLSALLFLRPGELRQIEWAWIDTEAALLTLPPTIMKRRKEEKANGAPHLVPLAPQALATLEKIQPLSGHGRYVFPSALTGERPMSDNTVRSALRRMGYTSDDATPHGFRASARTLAAERLGIAPEVIEAQLAHAVPDALGRAYNRTQYMAQRVDLMQRWADYLDQLRKGAQIIQLKTG